MTTPEPTPEAVEANLVAVKELANLLGEHPRADHSAHGHSCGGCQGQDYSLFAYYVHVAKAVLAAGYHEGGCGDDMLGRLVDELESTREQNERLRAQVARVEALAATDGVWKGEKHVRLTRRDPRLGCEITESYVTVDDLQAALDAEVDPTEEQSR